MHCRRKLHWVLVWSLLALHMCASGVEDASQELAFEQMRLAAQLSRGHWRRDFRPCSGAWNSTMAAEHEASFMLCVAGGSDNARDSDASGSGVIVPSSLQPVSAVSTGLMGSQTQRFCNCTRELHNAASCGHSSAQAILDQYEPWCFVIAACPRVGHALLHSARVCQAAGMRGENDTVLCMASGANECASTVEQLFEATHIMHGWVNDTVSRLNNLQQLQRHWHGLFSILTPWMASTSHHGSFDQLAGCLASVSVEESQLKLPMSLSTLSGNGSFTDYRGFFRARCRLEYELWQGLMDSALSLPGMDYAQDQWAAGHKATALAVLGANLTFLCLLGASIFRLVRRGHCYRFCSPSSAEERTGLKTVENCGGSMDEEAVIKSTRTIELTTSVEGSS